MWKTWSQMQARPDSGRFHPTPAITRRLPMKDIGKGVELAKCGGASKALLCP